LKLIIRKRIIVYKDNEKNVKNWKNILIPPENPSPIWKVAVMEGREIPAVDWYRK
jgi:hypothetical protein